MGSPLSNDRPAYYPIAMVISTGHKAALDFLSSAARTRSSVCKAHKVGLFVLTLDLTATAQSVVVFTRVSALEQAT